MSSRIPVLLSRRRVLEVSALAAAGLTLGRSLIAAQKEDDLPLITKPIPSTGEKLPVVGLGTNNYSVSDPEELAMRRDVLRRMTELGASVVDTAPAYGRSEEVIGTLVAEIGNRDKLFLATKCTARDSDVEGGRAMIEESFRRLRTDRIDLMQVHNLQGAEALIPVLQELKEAKRIRYIGVTTSNDAQHPHTAELMRRYPLDFVQVNYSIDDREAASRILPLARERGIAVLVNMPFGGRRGGNLFQRVSGRPLPDWAAEIDARSWGQFFLKYCVSHPAVTCAIPGTTKVSHLEDNQQAARGRLPDAALRRRMEQYWDSVA